MGCQPIGQVHLPLLVALMNTYILHIGYWPANIAVIHSPDSGLDTIARRQQWQ